MQAGGSNGGAASRFSLWWAALPLISLGLLSWAPFLYVAVRTRARRFQRLTGAYVGLVIAAGVLVTLGNGGRAHGHPSTANTAGGLLFLAIALGGMAHVLAIRHAIERALGLGANERVRDGSRGGYGDHDSRGSPW
jgi:hypothetical protein